MLQVADRRIACGGQGRVWRCMHETLQEIFAERWIFMAFRVLPTAIARGGRLPASSY